MCAWHKNNITFVDTVTLNCIQSINRISKINRINARFLYCSHTYYNTFYCDEQREKRALANKKQRTMSLNNLCPIKQIIFTYFAYTRVFACTITTFTDQTSTFWQSLKQERHRQHKRKWCVVKSLSTTQMTLILYA